MQFSHTFEKGATLYSVENTCKRKEMLCFVENFASVRQTRGGFLCLFVNFEGSFEYELSLALHN